MAGRGIFSAFIGVIWMMLFSSFTLPCFVAGALVGLGVSLLFDLIAGRTAGSGSKAYRAGEALRMTPWMISLFFVFVWELLKANVAVLVTVVHPKPDIKPGILALPVDLDSEIKIVLLANMITLTPGTISVEIAEDERTIYVHTLDCSDPQAVIDGINKAFTRRLKGMKWNDFRSL